MNWLLLIPLLFSLLAVSVDSSVDDDDDEDNGWDDDEEEEEEEHLAVEGSCISFRRLR